jgi:hypothetical protein
VLFDRRADLDFLDVDDFLLLAGLVGLFLLFIFVLAVVENLADRRIGGGRDFDEVETGFFCGGDGFAGGDDPDLLAVRTDQADAVDADFVVDARPVIVDPAWRRGIQRFANRSFS